MSDNTRRETELAGNLPSKPSRYVITVEFEIAPQDLSAFLVLVEANAAQTVKMEAGCLRFDVCVPEGGNSSIVFLYEVYVDRSHFLAHLQTHHFLEFEARTRNMVRRKDVVGYHATVNRRQ